ncbi:hypothetical protein ACFQ3Z_43120 [Streptomyces nogalater]
MKMLWGLLSRAGLPVIGPAAGHCVLLDTAAMKQFEDFEHPVPSCLDWIFEHTGVRGGPHLATGAGAAPLIRLAVPVGTETSDIREIGKRLARLHRSGPAPVELIPVDPAAPRRRRCSTPRRWCRRTSRRRCVRASARRTTTWAC